MKTTICFAGCFVFALAACESRYEISTSGSPAKENRTLAVSAKAVLEVRPDEAAVDFTFSSTDKQITRSHAMNTEKIDAFTRTLSTASIPSSNIVYGYMSYAPDYVYEDNKPPRIATYTSTTSLTVKTREFSKIPVIIDAAVASGLSSLGNVRFYSTQLPEQKKKVRDMALQAAKDKAKQLADGLGITLGKAIGVSEGGAYATPAGGYPSAPYQYNWLETGVPQVSNQVAQAYTSQAASNEPAGPISPGTTPLELTVDCLFEIE